MFRFAAVFCRVWTVLVVAGVLAVSHTASAQADDAFPQPVPAAPDTAVTTGLNANHSGTAAIAGLLPPLTQGWHRTFPGATLPPAYSTLPLYADGEVFTSDTHTIFALNAQTGAILWQRQLNDAIILPTSPIEQIHLTYDRGTLFILANSLGAPDGLFVRALAGATGDVVWNLWLSPGHITPNSTIVAHNGYVFLTDPFIAFYADKGGYAWQTDFHFSASQLAVTDDAVYGYGLSTAGPIFAKAMLETGALAWQRTDYSGSPFQTPVIADNRIYLRGSAGANGVILDTATGAQTGSISGGSAQMPPAIALGSAYIVSNQQLEAHDVRTWQLLWAVPLQTDAVVAGQPTHLVGYSTPLVINGVVYVGTTRGLFGYDAPTGALRWSATLGKPVVGRADTEAQTASDVGSGLQLGLGAGGGQLYVPAGDTLFTFSGQSISPTVTFASSISGLAGTPLTLTGTNFMEGVKVYVDGAAVPGTPRLDSTHLRVTMPLHPLGTADVDVVNPDGQTVRLPNAFMYVQPGFADTRFAATWYHADLPVLQGSAPSGWLYGPQSFLARAERYTQTEKGVRLVQYFDKARMELTGRVESPDAVTTGLLSVELVSGRQQDGDTTFTARTPATIPVAGDGDDATGPTYASFTHVATLPDAPHAVAANTQVITDSISRDGQVAPLASPPPVRATNAYYIRETGHNIPDTFMTWLLARGNWIATMGFPITEAYWAQVKVGGVEKTVLMQLYERRVLTFTPTNSPQYQVEYGNIGRHYYTWRYRIQPPLSQFAAPANANGIWRGKTAQGKTVFLTVENNIVTTFLDTFDGPTGCVYHTINGTPDNPPYILENAIAFSLSSIQRSAVDVAVRFTSSTTATGNVTHTFGSDMPGCGNPLTFTWTATKDPPATDALDGEWLGETSRGDNMPITVAHHTIRIMGVPFNVDGCSVQDSMLTFLDYYDPDNIAPNDTFRFVFQDDTHVLTAVVSGRFTSSTTVTGQIQFTVISTPDNPLPCAGTHVQTFRLTKKITGTNAIRPKPNTYAQNAWRRKTLRT